jgi:hypothetical protein
MSHIHTLLFGHDLAITVANKQSVNMTYCIYIVNGLLVLHICLISSQGRKVRLHLLPNFWEYSGTTMGVREYMSLAFPPWGIFILDMITLFNISNRKTADNNIDGNLQKKNAGTFKGICSPIVQLVSTMDRRWLFVVLIDIRWSI